MTTHNTHVHQQSSHTTNQHTVANTQCTCNYHMNTHKSTHNDLNIQYTHINNKMTTHHQSIQNTIHHQVMTSPVNIQWPNTQHTCVHQFRSLHITNQYTMTSTQYTYIYTSSSSHYIEQNTQWPPNTCIRRLTCNACSHLVRQNAV